MKPLKSMENFDEQPETITLVSQFRLKGPPFEIQPHRRYKAPYDAKSRISMVIRYPGHFGQLLFATWPDCREFWGRPSRGSGARYFERTFETSSYSPDPSAYHPIPGILFTDY